MWTERRVEFDNDMPNLTRSSDWLLLWTPLGLVVVVVVVVIHTLSRSI